MSAFKIIEFNSPQLIPLELLYKYLELTGTVRILAALQMSMLQAVIGF